jgi:vacuolar protein sorting-associated protein 41
LLQALGTHAGIIHILDLTGKRIKSYKPHLASVVDISLDATADFVATASIDGGYFFILLFLLLSDFTSLGQVVHSLSTPESYSFDMKRPMRTVAMDGTEFCETWHKSGLSGALVMREKGWLLGKVGSGKSVGEGDLLLGLTIL